jgi:hypothetical protein
LALKDAKITICEYWDSSYLWVTTTIAELLYRKQKFGLHTGVMDIPIRNNKRLIDNYGRFKKDYGRFRLNNNLCISYKYVREPKNYF